MLVSVTPVLFGRVGIAVAVGDYIGNVLLSSVLVFTMFAVVSVSLLLLMPRLLLVSPFLFACSTQRGFLGDGENAG